MGHWNCVADSWPYGDNGAVVADCAVAAVAPWFFVYVPRTINQWIFCGGSGGGVDADEYIYIMVYNIIIINIMDYQYILWIYIYLYNDVM